MPWPAGPRWYCTTAHRFIPDPGALWRIAEEEEVTVLRYQRPLSHVHGKRAPSDRPSESTWRRCAPFSRPDHPCPRPAIRASYLNIKNDVQVASISAARTSFPALGLVARYCPFIPGRSSVWAWACASTYSMSPDDLCAAPRANWCARRRFPPCHWGSGTIATGAPITPPTSSVIPNTWHHGDHALITLHGHQGLIILGRSDAMLKPGGVRIGTGELYAALTGMPEILESIAVGQRFKDDVRIVLFVHLAPGITLDEALTQRIRERIRAETTPRHVPARILAVADLPRTRSARHQNSRCVRSSKASPCAILRRSQIPNRLSTSAIWSS